MGYQALLFCPDEKLARVVSQVFGELDFAIEVVLEPFAAVKKLMARRYDAIVVDCENEQNASLLFKSARNSSVNQTSLAIALVEGQAGVAKAYRIGANLVLTKPINVEQAKGTLRVARGLLRKNADAAGATSASVSTPPAAATGSAPSSSSPSPHPPAAATAPAPATSRPAPQFETPLPAMPPAPPAVIPAVLPTMAASVKTEEQPAAPVPPPPPTTTAAAAEGSVSAPSVRHAPVAPTPAAPAPVTNDRARNDIVRYDAIQPQSAGFASALAPVQTASSTFPAPTASAAAAAPAKEAPAMAAPAHETHAPEAASSPSVSASPVAASPASSIHDVAPAAPIFGSVSDAPSFGVLDEEESEGSGGRKKILIAVAAILVLALLGYFAFGKFGKSSTPTPSAQPVTVPQNSGQSASAALPMSAPAESPSTNGPGRASPSSQTPTSRTQSTGAITIDKFGGGTSGGTSNSPANRIAAGASNPADAGAARPEAAPMVVKSTSVAKSVSAAPKTQAPADDAAPALLAPVGAASASESNLNGLMSSASPTIPKAAFETLKISQGVSQGLLIKRVQPKYPMAALAAHAGGAVQIEATINKEGSVVNPKVLKGDPILARAALDAVRQWRYKPYYLDGEPVEIQTEITINFKAN